MLSNIVFFLVISAFSLYVLFKYNKSCEETITIGCMGSMLIMFIFGLLGHMTAGVAVVLVASVVFYLLVCKEILANRADIKKYLLTKTKTALTPGTVIFVCLFALLNYVHIGRYIWIWDEFSHWGYAVKVMSIINDFNTNPMAYSWYPHYPPGMALFEYLLQKINQFVGRQEIFSEWRVYLAFHTFFAALFMPLFKNIKWKNVLSWVTITAVVLVLPATFFNILYYSVYIDGFLAASAGAAFAMILCAENKDWAYHLYMWCIIATIVLAKEIGVLLAGFILVMYIADVVLETYNKNKTTIAKSFMVSKIYIVASAASLFVPYMLWKNHVSRFSSKESTKVPASIGAMVDIITGKDTTYRGTTYEMFIDRMLERAIPINLTDIRLRYITEIVLAIVLIAVAIYLFKGKSRWSFAQKTIYFLTMSVMLVVYIIGMLIMYLFIFTEYEASYLAEFDRYIYIGLFPLCAAAFILICKKAQNYSFYKKNGILLAVLALVLAVMPTWAIKDTLNRSYVDRSHMHRSPYFEVTDKVMAECPIGGDYFRIGLIGQKQSGYEYMAIRQEVYPNRIHEISSNIESKSAEEMAKEINSFCDYVAIYNMKENFETDYAEIFANPSDIGANRLYKVDAETGKLVLVS